MLASMVSKKAMKLAAEFDVESSAATIRPDWVSNAANSVSKLPWRTYSDSVVATWPARVARGAGWRGGRGCSCSPSTLSTKAFSGGHRPHTSPARSQNSGPSLRRVIHERTRCGLMSKSARIRPI
jgi:hypothetical protein